MKIRNTPVCFQKVLLRRSGRRLMTKPRRTWLAVASGFTPSQSSTGCSTLMAWKKNDSNRSWLVVNAAEHSQILAFLCLKDVGLQADYSLDRAIQVAMGVADKMVKNIDPASSTYGRAIEELTKAISDSAIPRNFRGLWDKLTDVAPAAAKDIQETASRAAGCAVDDFSIFQLNSALARAGHVNQQESN